MNDTAPTTPPTRQRTERIGARVTSEQKQIIGKAAAFEGRTVSAFVLARVVDAARLIVEARRDPAPGMHQVLCRIDAFADYVAEVEADDAEEAVELARDNHADYTWAHSFTQEFDARLYVALDANGNEIEPTQVGDF
ncbi:MAG: DUF1778 domain-containing protein [Pseudomonadota bacterium]|nr:DUF1778 domain-containing protein [Pseudomonadota bacterium]